MFVLTSLADDTNLAEDGDEGILILFLVRGYEK